MEGAPYEEPREDEFLEMNEVEEEIAEDVDSVEPEEDEEEVNDMDMEDHETLEIDMSNNSWAYFDKHTDSVFKVFAHPLLPMVVTGGGDNTAYIWTTHKQPPVFVGELEGHKESVVAGAFTADGAYCVTGDMNGLVQVHKASRGGEKWTKIAELEEVNEVLWIATHPSLPYFAFGAPDGSVWVYQIEKTELVLIMTGFSHSLECNGGVFIDNKDENVVTLVTVAEDGTVVCWDCLTNNINYKLLPHTDFKSIESPWVTISVLGSNIAVGGRDGQLAIINNDTQKVVHAMKTLDDVDDIADLSIEAVAWCRSPAVRVLAVGLVSGDVLLLDTTQWRVRSSIKIEDAVTKLEFVGDTAFLVGSCMNGKIYKWDVRTATEVFAGVGHNMGVLDFVVVDGGKKLVTAGDEGVSLVFEC